ncbi:hypothetical protein TNIN_121521 [Trichonephila inaurata madagascariensis]|uniref:Uncharacterized protein n=1 Tax=Trichonephila inaurata madagascariensis TaxID=2747483 RepID=A0A8X6XLZ6_9ARAC|nr:hypothetical protein TNIN_121521 [Trichonephila inaurata madagascariensis]
MGKTCKPKRRQSRRCIKREESPIRTKGPLTRSDTIVHRLINEYPENKSIIEKPEVKFQVMMGLSSKPRRIITRSMLSILEKRNLPEIENQVKSTFNYKAPTNLSELNYNCSLTEITARETSTSLIQSIMDQQGPDGNSDTIKQSVVEPVNGTKGNEHETKQNNSQSKCIIPNSIHQSVGKRNFVSKQGKVKNCGFNFKNSNAPTTVDKRILKKSSKQTPCESRSTNVEQTQTGKGGVRSILKYNNGKNEIQDIKENDSNYTVNNDIEKPVHFSIKTLASVMEQRQRAHNRYTTQRCASKLNNDVKEKQDFELNNDLKLNNGSCNPPSSFTANPLTGKQVSPITLKGQMQGRFNWWIGRTMYSIFSFLARLLFLRY